MEEHQEEDNFFHCSSPEMIVEEQGLARDSCTGRVCSDLTTFRFCCSAKEGIPQAPNRNDFKIPSEVA